MAGVRLDAKTSALGRTVHAAHVQHIFSHLCVCTYWPLSPSEVAFSFFVSLEHLVWPAPWGLQKLALLLRSPSEPGSPSGPDSL